MQVKALKSFGAVINNNFLSVAEGDVVELPEGADWVRAGLVEPIADPVGAENASIDPTEKAVVATSTAKKATR